MSRKERPRKRHRILGVLVFSVGTVAAALTAFLAIAVGIVLSTYDEHANAMQPPEDMVINRPYDGARIYDRNGELLYEFVDEQNGLRRPIPLSEMSPHIIAATIATEDATFFTNAGVNIKGLGRATWENFSPWAAQTEYLQGTGGSSITQQLVKNVYIPQEERSERSIERKIKETVYALEITKHQSKEQILEWYLNQISYGGIYYGIEAASYGYFNKSAKDLTLAEAALLAGIPQSPSEHEPVNHIEASVARRNQVLELVRLHRGTTLLNGELLAITDEEIDAAMAEEAVLQPPGISLRAPHFIFTQVKPQIEAMYGKEGVYEQGLSVYTSIDINLQDQSQVAMEKWIKEFENISNSRNGAAVIVSPWTGEIWSYVGSRDYTNEHIQGRNDNLVSLNSPGSSFKPFIYLTAFMNIGWGPGTVIVDEPTRFRESDGTVFQPSNPNGKYNGRISLRDSLGNSLNIPAFKTAQAVGVPTIVATAKNMGFTTLNSTYGPSIAIGGVDLTAMDLAYGYSILASGGLARGSEPILEGGREVEPIAILSISDRHGEVIYNVEDHRREKRIIDPEYAFMVSSILSDPRAQCITFGCGGIQIPGRQVAVKTGTSEPYDPKSPDKGKIGETWAFGYTPDIVVGVWAGNSDNSPITNIYSTSISYRAMRDMLLNAYGNWRGNAFTQPANVVESTSCGTANGAVACRRDLVRKTDEQKNQRTAVVDVTVPGAEGGPQPGDGSTAPGGTQSGAPAGGGGALNAAITSPSGSVSGTVTIRGTATAPRMAGYTLQWRGPDGAWRTIGSWSVSVANGTLGAWSTSGLAPGEYAIRLTVRDSSGATDESIVSVTIGGGGAPAPTTAPSAQPSR